MSVIEDMKRKKRYGQKVCPKCNSPMHDIFSDFQHNESLGPINIGGKVIGREMKNISVEFNGTFGGFECQEGHKWGDNIQLKSVIAKCPNEKCNGFLEKQQRSKPTNNNIIITYLECQNLNSGCYVSIDPSKLSRNYINSVIPHIISGNTPYGWKLDYFKKLGGLRPEWWIQVGSIYRPSETLHYDKDNYSLPSNISEPKPEFLACPECGVNVKPENLDKHLSRTHGLRNIDDYLSELKISTDIKKEEAPISDDLNSIGAEDLSAIVDLCVPNFIEPETSNEIVVYFKNVTSHTFKDIIVDFSYLENFFNVDGTVKIGLLAPKMELKKRVCIKSKFEEGVFPIKVKLTCGNIMVEKKFTIKVGGTEIY